VSFVSHHPSYLPHVDEVHRHEIEALATKTAADDEFRR
jgi:hypothetical protein